jgi:hypothetical protein
MYEDSISKLVKVTENKGSMRIGKRGGNRIEFSDQDSVYSCGKCHNEIKCCWECVNT